MGCEGNVRLSICRRDTADRGCKGIYLPGAAGRGGISVARGVGGSDLEGVRTVGQETLVGNTLGRGAAGEGGAVEAALEARACLRGGETETGRTAGNGARWTRVDGSVRRSIIQQYRDVVGDFVHHRKVCVSVGVYVRPDYENGAIPRREVLLVLERAVAVAEQDGDVVGFMVRNREVVVAVPIQVCAGYGGGGSPHCKVLLSLEAPVALT